MLIHVSSVRLKGLKKVDTFDERSVPVEGEDFYREGAFVVFTARYHLRRGYCCESGCRHCPYRAASQAHAKSEEEAEGEA